MLEMSPDDEFNYLANLKTLVSRILTETPQDWERQQLGSMTLDDRIVMLVKIQRENGYSQGILHVQDAIIKALNLRNLIVR